MRRVRKRRRSRKILVVALLMCCILCGAFFGYVDYLVGRRLGVRGEFHLPVVYADALVLGQNFSPSVSLLKTELLQRGYSPVLQPPTDPGEFRCRESNCELCTRGFTRADSSTAGGRCGIYQDGQDPTEHEQEALVLEPTILTQLSGDSKDVQARSSVSLSATPKHVAQAVLAIEDERFYQHFGIDPIGIARALFTNLMQRRWVQGGSTLSQQLAKNLFLTPEKTLLRKAKEALAALSLERRLSKDRILELYLNEVYLGQEGSLAVHGFAQAAKAYFGKSIDELSLADAALLAGIIKAPSYYNPRRHRTRALKQRNVVLTKMQELGYISASQAAAARDGPQHILSESPYQREAPYFIAALRERLGQDLNLDAAIDAGVVVYTGILPALQNCAESALRRGLASIEKQFPALSKKSQRLQAALVSIEPYSGKIRAWVGGTDYANSQFDRVSQALRPIGSTIKPFLYLTALDGSLNQYKVATALSVLSDERVSVDLVTRDTWEPENFDHQYRGDVTLRYALENSLNLPAVYIAQRVGLRSFAETLSRFRVGESIDQVPALALGAMDTNLLRLAAAYGALANGGHYVAPRLFVSALGPDGTKLASAPILEKRVASESATFVLTNILQGVVERGTARKVRQLGYKAPVAGKTGTSNDSRDSWFVGFTPGLVTGVWVGFDDNQKSGLTGGSGAVPIWTEYMLCAQEFYEPQNFVMPAGVVTAVVDVRSGQLAGRDCPSENRVSEVFVEGTEPQTLCRLHNAEYIEPPPSYQAPAASPTPRRRQRSFWDNLFGE